MPPKLLLKAKTKSVVTTCQMITIKTLKCQVLTYLWFANTFMTFILASTLRSKNPNQEQGIIISYRLAGRSIGYNISVTL